MKENFFDKIIPTLENMIQEEKKHIEKLEEIKRKRIKLQKNWLNYIFPVFSKSDIISIETTIDFNKVILNHYETRLTEYKEYSKTLK